MSKGWEAMNGRKLVLRQTGILALSLGIGTGLMLVVFALLERFDRTVLLGGVFGLLLALGNFFFMAVTASLAADKAESQDVKGGMQIMRGSYPLRLAVLAVALILLAKSGLCNIITLVVPLALVRPVLMVADFFEKKGA